MVESQVERSPRQMRIATVLVAVTGVIAAAASVPQLVQVWVAQSAEGLSLATFLMFYSAQLALAYNGWVHRSKSQLITVGLTALTTTALIGSIIYFRYFV